MNLTIDISQIVHEIFEDEDRIQVSVAEKILHHIDLNLMKCGNDKVKICNLLTMRSLIRKELKSVRGIII